MIIKGFTGKQVDISKEITHFSKISKHCFFDCEYKKCPFMNFECKLYNKVLKWDWEGKRFLRTKECIREFGQCSFKEIRTKCDKNGNFEFNGFDYGRNDLKLKKIKVWISETYTENRKLYFSFCGLSYVNTYSLLPKGGIE